MKMTISRRLLNAAGCAALFAAALLPAGRAAAQTSTLTISGCASLSATATSATNISITCTPPATTPGGPTCSSLTVSPANDSTAPGSITLTANCSAGTNPITGYTFTGTGAPTTVQTGNVVTITPAPTGTTTFTVKATDGTNPSNVVSGTYTVGSVTPPPVGSIDMTACTAAGFTGIPVDVAYSTTGNVRPPSSGFNNSTALVIRFTPSSTITVDSSSLQLAASQSFMRIAALSTSPGVFPRSATPSGNILWATQSVQPTVNMRIGSSAWGSVTLTAGTTYYMTVVNRNGYYGTTGWNTSTCTSGSCNVNVDFNN